jgi:hypothetical protein
VDGPASVSKDSSASTDRVSASTSASIEAAADVRPTGAGNGRVAGRASALAVPWPEKSATGAGPPEVGAAAEDAARGLGRRTVRGAFPVGAPGDCWSLPGTAGAAGASADAASGVPRMPECGLSTRNVRRRPLTAGPVAALAAVVGISGLVPGVAGAATGTEGV